MQNKAQTNQALADPTLTDADERQTEELHLVSPELVFNQLSSHRYRLDAAVTGEREPQWADDNLPVERRPQALARPSHEVALNPAHMDHHLVTLIEFDPRPAEQYDRLAVSLISAAVRRPFKRVLICSARHGEGRTCVTLNLAGALTRAGKRVLVIDGDLQQPSVLRLLGIEAETGLVEMIERNLPPGAAILRVLPAGFNVLGTRERVSSSAHLLAAPAFDEALQMFDPEYDFILFDSPPLLDRSDAHLLALLTNTTLFVIRPGFNSAAQMARALSRFTEEDLCGVVLNRVEP
jgi:protein-tyrosine kinase